MMVNNNDLDDLLGKLDTIIAIMQLAFREQINSTRDQVLSDTVSAAILQETAVGWMDAGELRSRVAQQTKQSERTVSRRIADLLSLQALQQVGNGSKIRYKATGLI